MEPLHIIICLGVMTFSFYLCIKGKIFFFFPKSLLNALKSPDGRHQTNAQYLCSRDKSERSLPASLFYTLNVTVVFQEKQLQILGYICCQIQSLENTGCLWIFRFWVGGYSFKGKICPGCSATILSSGLSVITHKTCS